MLGIARNHLLVRCFVALCLVVGLAGCSEQETVPLDIEGTIPLVEPPAHSDTGNEEARAQGQLLAEQQCLDDPTLEEGIVQIAKPDTNVVVAEIVVDCSEVR